MDLERDKPRVEDVKERTDAVCRWFNKMRSQRRLVQTNWWMIRVGLVS